MDLYTHFMYLFSCLAEIQYAIHSAAEPSWVWWKSAHGKPYFSYRLRWNCIYSCTVQPCDVPKVKNAPVVCLLRHGVHHLQSWH